MAIESITPGAPPLLWSNIQEAFDIINQNFTELNARTDDGSSGGVNFSNLFTNVSPANTNLYVLGQPNKTWKSLFLSEIINVSGNQDNGLWIGSAQISGNGGAINLPANSTIGGDPIINEENTSFKTVIANGSSIVAETFTDTLVLSSGTGLDIVADVEDKIVSFLNTGVVSLNGTAGQIGVSSSTGNVTLTNLGVVSLTNPSYSPANPVASPILSFANRAPGAGISISQSTGNIVITNTGILSIGSGGGGILVDFDPTTGRANISNTEPNVEQDVFTIISILGQADVVQASGRTDTLTLIEGYGIQLTNNPTQKSVTVGFINDTTINGSVVGSGGTLLVDSVNDRIVGPVFSDVTGNVNGDLVGSVFGDDSTLLVDAVNNIIPYAVLNGAPTALSDFNNDLDYAGIVGTTIQNNGLPVDTFMAGNLDAQNNNIIDANLVNATGNLTGDVRGSVFADDSTLLIDGVNGVIPGYVSIEELKTALQDGAGDFAAFKAYILGL